MFLFFVIDKLVRQKYVNKYVEIINRTLAQNKKIKIDMDKNLIKKINRPQQKYDNLFQDVDKINEEEPVEILFKEQIDCLRINGLQSYITQILETNFNFNKLEQFFNDGKKLYIEYKTSGDQFPKRG